MPSWTVIGTPSDSGRSPRRDRSPGSCTANGRRTGFGRRNAPRKPYASVGRARKLAHRRGHVFQGKQRHAEKTIRRRPSRVVGEPVVVGAAQGCVQLDVRDLREEEAERRVQDGDVDAFAVHVEQALLRVPAARRELPVRGPGRHRQRAGRSHDVAVVDDVTEVAVLVAGGTRDAVPEALLGVLGPQLRRLDHVAVAIEHEIVGNRPSSRLVAHGALPGSVESHSTPASPPAPRPLPLSRDHAATRRDHDFE